MFAGKNLRLTETNPKLKYILIIVVLGLAFSAAFIMRSYPAKYGYYLNEFDPYFDYRATQFIVENGIEEYFKWHDTMSWHPEGRQVASTSQSGLHITAAILYMLFGWNISLMDFIIILPVIFGSLSVFVIFLLVRVLSNTTAGLLSSLFFAFSPSIIQRGNLGWFKSEPLGLLLGLSATYLLISSLRHKEKKIALIKSISGGLILGLASASWGGVQYFAIPISIFFIALAFYKNTQFRALTAITFVVFTILSVLLFPRPGISFVLGLPGIALIGSAGLLGISAIIQRINSTHHIRNIAIIFTVFIILSVVIVNSGIVQSPSFRYLNAINPFLSAQNPLTESVAEHFTPTLVDYFTDYSILLIFAGFGAWALFKKRNEYAIFALIIGFTSVYVSGTFARLMVYASIGIILLASVGIAELFDTLIRTKIKEQREKSVGKEKQKVANKIISKDIYSNVPFLIAIVFLICIPLFYPNNANWISSADIPPSIANGGTGYRTQTDDWFKAMEWLKDNTPKDSVIASWWDYGYWITTLANRTTIADNATINQTRIQTIAKMFMSDEPEAYRIINDLDADYILLYIVAQRYPGFNNTSFYTLGSGGDESKKQWFIRIGGFNEGRFVEQDGFTPKEVMWNSTLLGKMIPFEPQAFVSQNGGLQLEYLPGSTGIYSKSIKYPVNTTSNNPLSLVYASDSFNTERPGLVFGILIYKVNESYDPSIEPADQKNEISPQTIVQKGMTNTNEELNSLSTSNETAVIDTTQGQIKIQFFDKAAPKHVENFKKLSTSGFYNNTIFHRIVKDFVIQGGDPNTKSLTNKNSWGTGDPGYTVDAEFSNISHTRGIVSMARSSDPNSAGSQFFIVLQNSTFLDNQYSVFGRVTEGMDIVDRIASTATDAQDRPIDPNFTKINSVKIIPNQ